MLRKSVRREYSSTRGSARRETEYAAVLNLADESPIKKVFDVVVDLSGSSAEFRGTGALILQF